MDARGFVGHFDPKLADNGSIMRFVGHFSREMADNMGTLGLEDPAEADSPCHALGPE